MKNRIKALLICMIIVLSIGMSSFAISPEDCHHDYNVTTITEEVVTYPTSMYVEKNGRLDWWPVVVTEKYNVVHYFCRDCGKPIPELEVWRIKSISWRFQY